MRWIIVTGLPATGKSTLARQLAARYGLPLLAKDFFKEPLLQAAGPVTATRSRELSNLSFTRLFARLGELAGNGADVLLEGNFRAGEHEAQLNGLPPARLAQVLCRCDERARQLRMAARTADPTRHPGHGDARATRDASNDRFLQLAGEQLLLDTSDTGAAASHEQLLQRLDRWWQEVVTSRAAR
jgi:predicted kinase